MRKLLLSPDAESYALEDAKEVIAVELEGGPGRFRRDKIGSSLILDAAWTLNQWEYQYWRAFFNTAIAKGTEAFLCDLIGDGCELAEHTCNALPGTISVPSQMGRTYIAKARLEVRQRPVDDVANTAIIAGFAG